MKKFFLDTERLVFSVWSQEDLPDAMELWGNPEVTKFVVAGGKMSREQVEQRLRKEIETYDKSDVQYWPVYLKEINRIIGCCGLRPYDPDKKVYEMGVYLKEEYFGKGLAKEACIAVIKYAFDTLNVEAIFVGHNPNNIRSARLIKKLGFKYTHEEFYAPTGLNHPSYLMTREEYAKVG
jgi:RimJ/RimL family protein N-acetyltransferase